MRFQFQYTLGREDFIALNSMLNQTGSGRGRKMIRWVFMLLGVLFAGFGVMYLQQKHYVAGPVLLLMGLLLLYRLRTMGRLSKRQAGHLADSVAGERCVMLEEAGIRIRDNGSEALAPYEGVQQLLFLDQRYFLVFDRRRILLLPLSAMTAGDPEALRPFLEEKLGRETEELV